MAGHNPWEVGTKSEAQSNGGPEENRKGTITLNGVKETNGIVPKDQKDIKEKQRSIRYRLSLV